MEANTSRVLGRVCGACTLCCKVLGIPELKKPEGIWCPHCHVGKGCKIYESRPEECQAFLCTYLIEAAMPEFWQPNKSKMVVERGENSVTAHVDPGTPEAWRKEPFYSEFLRMAGELAPTLGQVLVHVGKRVIAFLPDNHVDLGVVQDDETVVIRKRTTQRGVQLSAAKMKRDDPRLSGATQN